MAVTLATLQTEVQTLFNESTTTVNGIFTSAFVIALHNQFLDEKEWEMKLELAPISYTLAADASSVSMSTIGSTLLSVRLIETLDDAGDVAGHINPLPRGSSSGYYIWNDTVYFNGDTSDDTTDLRFWGFRKGTRATATTDNCDIHSGNERAVFLPYLLWGGYMRAKKPVVADGFRLQFENAFAKMLKKRARQANPLHETFGVHEDYGPLTG